MNKNTAKRSIDEMDENISKRRKKTDTITQDLICPITLELPYDPVMARDGRIYERSAIQKHIDNCKISELRSPVTNEPIDSSLVPSRQTKSHIEALIKMNLITGELAENWNAAKNKDVGKDKTELEEMIEKANAGDVDKMFELGNLYKYGDGGEASENIALSYKWYKKASNNGNLTAKAYIGKMLLCEDDEKEIPFDREEGMKLLSAAANEGSDLAAYMLGEIYTGGLHDMPRDKIKARCWYKAAINPSLGGHRYHKSLQEGTIRYIKREMLGTQV